jgi:hypothetical protein
MSKVDKYIAYMIELVTNPKHGYDQINRWGPDYDCSSSIICSVQYGAGIPVKDAGATYTGNMRKAFEKCGFISISCKNGMPTLCRGDILLNEKHHTCMFIGDGKVAQFSINEKGKTTGGASGNQTGRESSIGPVYTYSKGWNYVLRYQEKEEDIIVNVELRQIQLGSQCPEVGTAQTLLNALGYLGKNGKVLTVDHQFGQNVEFAVKNFQKAHGIGQDGVVGSKTWTALLKADY